MSGGFFVQGADFRYQRAHDRYHHPAAQKTKQPAFVGGL